MATPDVLQLIATSAERFADRPALHTQSGQYSYRELVALARGIRRLLQTRGLQRHKRIGIVTGDDAHTYASLLAIWSLGSCYVPLNRQNPARRNGQIIEQAGIEVILTSRPQEQWPAHLPLGESRADIVETAAAVPDPGPLVNASFDIERLAYILFTSGSTGAPKGVPISHANLSCFMVSIQSKLDYDFQPQDRYLQMFELTFDLSVMSVFSAWCVGAATFVVPESGIAYMNIIDMLQKHKLTVALMVPSLLAYLRRFFAEIELPELRLNLFCGEALMSDMLEGWAGCVPNAHIENVYGPTEATIFCTTYRWHREQSAQQVVSGIVPIGKAMPNMETLIVDPDGQPCMPGTRGELCLVGEQVMSGYWQDSEKTRQAFQWAEGLQPAYKTGDICFVDDRGDLIYCGRMDSQVKIDGHRLELGEIEHFVRQFVGHSKVAVIVAADAAQRDFLRLFIGASDLDEGGLRRSLAASLPPYMQPAEIVRLADLPLNLNGKIDRVALKVHGEELVG